MPYSHMPDTCLVRRSLPSCTTFTHNFEKRHMPAYGHDLIVRLWLLTQLRVICPHVQELECP